MNHSEKRLFLIRALLDEVPDYQNIVIPFEEDAQNILLRSLFNVRMPGAVSEDFLKVQDEFLKEEISAKGITELPSLTPVQPDIYLWQGDITTLSCDAIVNAANAGMTGCYQPCHNCIDNCIHTYAGVQLRNYCAELMEKQGHEEPTGQVKITPFPSFAMVTSDGSGDGDDGSNDHDDGDDASPSRRSDDDGDGTGLRAASQ